MYDDVIQDQLKDGVIEKVNKEEYSPPGQVHYLPHREVIRYDKDTTKLRVVFDASAKANGPSLNDCLYVGPPLSPLLYDILLRFRVHKIAMTADIEKAFLNIAIAPQHRDFLRFLWPHDPMKINSELDCFRFTRVVFGVNSSPFLLNATIRHHLESYQELDPDFVAEVLRSLYVDDYASGSSETNEAFTLVKKIQECFLQGGFNMRKWLSNSGELMNLLNDHDKSNMENPRLEPTVEQRESHKVLGLQWKYQQDLLVFEFSNILAGAERQKGLTKRVVLSTAAKFYDLLGLIAPITVLLKVMFQQLCKNNLGWDDHLDQPFQDKWDTFLDDLKKVRELTVERCYWKDTENQDVKSIEIHGFGDASKEAYGACIYLRYECDGHTYCRLVTSKTRVAPIAQQSIPRLELLACLVTSRLMNRVEQALANVLKFKDMYCWTDSSIALAWINATTKEFRPFVENRVIEIRKLTPPELWRHCPTESNPADIASRGANATDLVNNSKWWEGPEFFKSPRSDWPALPTSACNGEVDIELKKTSKTRSIPTSANVVTSNELSGDITKVIDSEHYSSSGKLFRITAYVLRFLANLRSKMSKNRVKTGDLTLDELHDAEKLWFKSVQAILKKENRFPQLRVSLNLVEDGDGLLRCHSRMQNAPVDFNSRCPILLPEDNHISKLIVMQCHNMVMHNGVRETLTQLRTKFWIVRGRQVVKKIISKCVVCQKIEGKGYGIPYPPPLPPFRLTDEFAFSRIGLDYAGPVYVKDIYTRAKMNKAYIALYTCASTRALHLNLVPELSSQAFLRSFRRFVARRGIPARVLSDNAKTFKSMDVDEYIRSIGVVWSYNIEGAPWWGGFFERTVKSVKRCLKKVIGLAKLTYEELLTILIEVECVLNSRPLTYVYDDATEPLTPSHLVLGKRLLTSSTNRSYGNQAEASSSRDELQKRAQHLEMVLNHFWNRWRKEYLTELREHHRRTRRSGKAVQVGDIVCVYEDKIPRQQWKLARIVNLFTGRDAEVRAAALRVCDKSGKVIEMRRPLQKLFPLEVENCNENDEKFPVTFVKNAKEENVDV